MLAPLPHYDKVFNRIPRIRNIFLKSCNEHIYDYFIFGYRLGTRTRFTNTAKCAWTFTVQPLTEKVYQAQLIHAILPLGQSVVKLHGPLLIMICLGQADGSRSSLAGQNEAVFLACSELLSYKPNHMHH